MTNTVLIVAVVVLAITVVALAAPRLRQRTRRRAAPTASSDRRILFPFVAEDLSRRALDAALRLAAAEGATLVPVFLARVSLDLPLDTPLPRQCAMGVPLLETIEQRAAEAGVPVDSRIERGRNRRHALRRAIAEERFDQIVMAAASRGSHGFDADDVAWLLDHARGEIVVLRPAATTSRELQAEPTMPLGLQLSEARVRPEWQAGAAISREDEMAGSR